MEEIRDRDFSFHYPPHIEGMRAALRIVHRPTGRSVEGWLDERDGLLATLKEMLTSGTTFVQTEESRVH